METHSGPGVDVLDEAFKELSPVLLAMADGIGSLASQDGQELRFGLEEATALAGRGT